MQKYVQVINDLFVPLKVNYLFVPFCKAKIQKPPIPPRKKKKHVTFTPFAQNSGKDPLL